MVYTDYFWDFDGTLFDTYARVTEAWRLALKSLDIDVDPPALLSALKISMRPAAEAYLRPRGLSYEKAHDIYSEYEHGMGWESMRPYEGAEDTLRAICQNGGRNYLYTHRGPCAEDALRHYAMDGYFSDFVNGTDGFPLKPAPDALLYLLEKHSLDHKRCIMIGDRDIDLEAGKNAGISGALFDPDGFYTDYAAQYRFRTMAELRAGLVTGEDHGK